MMTAIFMSPVVFQFSNEGHVKTLKELLAQLRRSYKGGMFGDGGEQDIVPYFPLATKTF